MRKFKLRFSLQDMDQAPVRTCIFGEDKQVVIELREDDIKALSLALSRKAALDLMPKETDEQKKEYLEAFDSYQKQHKYSKEVLEATVTIVQRYCLIELEKYLAMKEDVSCA